MAKYKPLRKLRAIRRAADMTQKELAEKVGIAQKAVCGYETGQNSPSLPKLERLAAALNVEPRDLI